MRRINGWMALIVGSAAVLAGCGGGGDGGGPDPQPGTTTTTITEANAAQVSVAVYRAASLLFDVTTSTGELPLGAAVNATAAGPASRLGLAGFAARQLKAARGRSQPAALAAVGAVVQDTLACAGGGTVTTIVDDADNDGEVSVGDSLRFTFESCVEDGVVSDGGLAFRLTALSDNSFSARLTFGPLKLNDGTNTISADGVLDLTTIETPGVSEVYNIAGDALIGSLNGDQHVLTGFRGSAVTDLVRSTVSYTFEGRVADSSNQIVVDAATTSALVAQLADDFPGSGSLLCTGAGNSRALLEALSPTQVRISADPEGDGSFTAPVTWSWSALTALPS